MNDRTMFPEDGAAPAMNIVGDNYSLPSYDEYHMAHPDRPMIGTENGVILGTRGCYETRREQYRLACNDAEYMPYFNSIRETVNFFNERPWICGYFLWSGFDYQGELVPFGWPAISSYFGLMDTCGFPKGGYWLYHALIKTESVLHLEPDWSGTAGENIRVVTISNCDEVELFLNGRSLGRCAVMDNETVEMVNFEAGTIRSVGYRQGSPCAEAIRKPLEHRLYWYSCRIVHSLPMMPLM